MSFVNAHFVTYARDLGFSPMVAAGAFSLIGAASIVGALILGHLSDKHGRRLWLSFSYNLRSVGFLVVLLSMGISFLGIPPLGLPALIVGVVLVGMVPTPYAELFSLGRPTHALIGCVQQSAL